MNENVRIKSFRDLDVYQSTYNVMLVIMKEIVPKLPESEKYDLRDQLSRACKSIPRLIAEGYAKRHQKAGFQKYLDDAMGESNEMVVSISQVRDIYFDFVNVDICDQLIDAYDKAGRQLYKLSNAWRSFKSERRN
ncbi:four helix bundle protein [Chlamydiota bacterium]